MPDQLASRVGERISSTGEVTYDFEGHVHADGLDLDTWQGDPEAILADEENRVSWLDPVDTLPDGFVVAFRSAVDLVGTILGAIDRPGNLDTGLHAWLYDDAGALVDGVNLLNTNQESGFLRRAVESADRVIYGVTTVNTNGLTSTTKTVSHGLNHNGVAAAPTIVLATIKNLGSPRLALVDNFTTSAFDLQVRHAGGGTMGSNTDVCWLAIG